MDSKGEYDQVLIFYFKSLEIEQKFYPEIHSNVAITYESIGLVFYSLGEYDLALEYLFKSLEIEKEDLPENHPDIAITYSNIDSVYKSKSEYEKALEYFFLQNRMEILVLFFIQKVNSTKLLKIFLNKSI